MKVWHGNYDGKRVAMVAARNQKEAAAAIGTSIYDLRQYYTSFRPETDEEIAAALEPLVVWVREANSNDEWIRRDPIKLDVTP